MPKCYYGAKDIHEFAKAVSSRKKAEEDIIIRSYINSIINDGMQTNLYGVVEL